MNPLIQLRKITILPLLIALGFACFGLSPQAVAVCQEGCDLINDNTFLGDDVLISNTTGGFNTATGARALSSNTTGSDNTAVGVEALKSNTTGIQNTAVGVQALNDNTTGGFNTASGVGALFSNTTASFNTATGALALVFNTTGDDNTAVGATALVFNTTGNDNTATGVDALNDNTTGNNNTAMGSGALFGNTTGGGNTAIGFDALNSNTTGVQNTAVGAVALFNNATGTENTAIGVNACANTTGSHNTAIGFDALFNNSTGSDNIALGYLAGTQITGDHNIVIGNESVAGESDTIRIGVQGLQTATYIAGVSGGAVAGAAVKVNAAGKIGTAPSSARFKQNVKSMGDTSDALFALRPVTFRYKQEIDPEGIQEFGLVAEEVEKVDPNLVIRDADGKPYTVRYEAVNAMLLNEFLEEHGTVQQQSRKIHEMEKTVAELKSVVTQQQKAMRTLASGLEKVSAELELRKPGPQVAIEIQ